MPVSPINEMKAASPRSGGGALSGLGNILDELYSVIEARKRERPDGSYTTYLFNSGLDKILKKIAEEAGEVIIASKNGLSERVAEETADLLYHILVLLCECGVGLAEIREELMRRRSDSKPDAAEGENQARTVK